jgi:signal transduction histidine kinase
MPKTTPLVRLKRYQRLIRISRDLASTLDLDVLLSRIVQAAADLSYAEAASILLFDQNKNELYFQAASNLDEPLLRGLIVPVDSSIAGWIVTHQEPIIINDVKQDNRHYENIAEATEVQTNSLLGVPLITKNKVIGVLEAINKQEGNFTEEDQEILMTLGAQAAVAIENTKLFQQSDLIADFVHEIRTPLSSIGTAAHLLLNPKINDEKRTQMAEVIKDETNRLADMATSFLDLARLESGRVQFQVNEIDPAALIMECDMLMRGKAQESGLYLMMDTETSLPHFNGDYDKIKQAVINLISNAIKYNKPGGMIRLKAEADQQEIRFSVSDTGIGIPPEYIDKLFTKFYRIPGTEECAEGTGLGLSVVKRITEGHGGRVSVSSEVGEETTFTIHIPR